MNYPTHLAFGLLWGLLVFQDASFVIVVLIASLLPDIDHPQAKMGKVFKPFSFLFSHRGFFHSLFPLIFFLLLTQLHAIFLAIALGYTSHLVLDALTRKGIMPFHPISRYKLKGPCKSGGITEYVLLISFLFIDILLIAAKTI
tara:strand:- start:1450 stop:1878 length:429 start_codon:yes stop_codon:yes gene_type:complete